MSIRALEELQRQGYTPSTMLDVGAHIGTFAKSFLDVFPRCKPVLIEPNPFCQDDLGKLGLERHAIAASNETGQATLFLTKEWLQSTGTSLYRENTHFFRDEVVVKREVPKVRIDDLFRGRRFDFVKIDTQGSELDVLRGGAEILKQSDYILVEISLVEYNLGGARAEDVFAQLDAMGFSCAGVTDFHRLSSVKNGDLLQMDFLFERRNRRTLTSLDDTKIAEIRALATKLQGEGREKDALLLLEHLAVLQPHDVATLRALVQLQNAQGTTLKALDTLAVLKNAVSNTSDVLPDIQESIGPAVATFNKHLADGEIEKAERYAAALVVLAPGNPALLSAALSCNLALNRKEQAAKYQMALRAVTSTGTAISGEGKTKEDIESRIAKALTDNGAHPLLRLRDLHDLMSEILCHPLDKQSDARLEKILTGTRALNVSVAPESEWAAWEKHYRVMIDAADINSIRADTPEASTEPPIEFMTSSGKTLTWVGLRKEAEKAGAKCIFFAAADRHYVDLYARWYVKSILKHCEVPCLVVVHVIGGARQLPIIIESVGIRDDRLVFSADSFDAAAVSTACYDSPPKGRIEKPVAHLQSARFLRLGALLREVKLPVFVSDIDLLLQKGVSDLLDRCPDDDIVLNENAASAHAGSRLTANLLLVNPTANADIFLRYLRDYLERMLARPEVSRWIDQFALLFARHHLWIKGNDTRIGYFDTTTDINNVMYPSYQKDHPFRFLSLYHGFDLSSLEDASEGGTGHAPEKSQRKSLAA